METDIKTTFTLILSNWIRLSFDDNDHTEFPSDIIQLIVNVFVSAVEFLKWDSKLKSSKTGLTDDEQTAYRNYGPNEYGNPWVIPDCDPVKSAVAVWRVKV